MMGLGRIGALRLFLTEKEGLVQGNHIPIPLSIILEVYRMALARLSPPRCMHRAEFTWGSEDEVPLSSRVMSCSHLLSRSTF